MPAIVIEELPADLQKRLETQAMRNHRSVSQEAVTILDRALPDIPPVILPTPIKPLKRVTAAMIHQGIMEGRE